jgi:hypothetical protein
MKAYATLMPYATVEETLKGGMEASSFILLGTGGN